MIRHLYDRPMDTIVATWGLSLIATQGTLIVLGSSMPGVGVPLGSFTVGAYSYSTYRLVLIVAALAVLVGLYLAFNKTRFGVLARATIQLPQMAEALGVDTKFVYSITFALGAALAGLAGGLYAPTMTHRADHGQHLHHGSVRHRRGRRRRRLSRHGARRCVLAVVKAAMTSWQGQLFGQIGLLGRRDHRRSGPAEGDLRLPAARTHLKDPTQ